MTGDFYTASVCHRSLHGFPINIYSTVYFKKGQPEQAEDGVFLMVPPRLIACNAVRKNSGGPL